jgi:hypothetical protein
MSIRFPFNRIVRGGNITSSVQYTELIKVKVIFGTIGAFREKKGTVDT